MQPTTRSSPSPLQNKYSEIAATSSVVWKQTLEKHYYIQLIIQLATKERPLRQISVHIFISIAI